MSQEQVYERLFQLFTKLGERSASLKVRCTISCDPRFGLQAANRRIERLTRALWATLERHPEWPLSSLRWELSRQETQMVVVLIGKDLGLCDADDELFLGDGIARAASTEFPKGQGESRGTQARPCPEKRWIHPDLRRDMAIRKPSMTMALSGLANSN